MKHTILAQILDQSARARREIFHIYFQKQVVNDSFAVNTLLLGKPEKGQMVENMLLKMAQVGQIRNKLGEKDLIGILESVNAQIPQANTSVKFDRRRAALDSEEEDF